MRIDTHQHLLAPARFGYAWTAGFPSLCGDRFQLADYKRAAARCNIVGSVFMEVDVDEGQAAAEAEHFCALAAESFYNLLGVVASGRPEHADFPAHLERIAHPILKGLRRVLHTQPDAVSCSTLFRANLNHLASLGLSFDLCVLARQLPLAADLADACPGLTFILDHAGLPPLTAAPAAFAVWREDLLALSRRPNVHAKLSGLVTCCPPGKVSVPVLQPAFDHLLACFGPNRLVWGGDWPVCELATDLSHWCAITDILLAPLTSTERDAILHVNARRLYRLAPASLV
jgi:predicted TIM-barrel fold metal-dependent hydrolase